ncbi:unnamed protein product [Amoebophrya sp. A25]|nr:unnamed protein product [Amoebophrya sp. A25]|eukprot:GSA25T00024616001.1
MGVLSSSREVRPSQKSDEVAAALDVSSDYSFDDDDVAALGEPKIVRPFRDCKDVLFHIFTIPRIVLLGLLVITLSTMRPVIYSDLPSREWFADIKKVSKVDENGRQVMEELVELRTTISTHLDRVRALYEKPESVYWEVDAQVPVDPAKPNGPTKTVRRPRDAGEKCERQQSRGERIAPLGTQTPQELKDEYTSKFCTWRQYVVLNLILLMVVFMVEGIPPEMAIFTVILVSYAFSWISYSVPLSQYCTNGSIPADYSIRVEPFLFLENGLDAIFTGLKSKNTLIYAGMFVLTCAFTETKILEKLLGAVIGTPKSHWAVILRLMIPGMILSSVCPNGPMTQMCMPLAVAICDKVGIYSTRTYYMALAFAVTMGGNLTLVGSTPCIYALNAFKMWAKGGGQAQTRRFQMCRETVGKVHNWLDFEDPQSAVKVINLEGMKRARKIVGIDVVDEAMNNLRVPGFRFTDANYEKIVESQCTFSTLDLGFLTLGLLVAVAALPAIWYAIWVFAREEDKQRALESEAESGLSDKVLGVAGSIDGSPSSGLAIVKEEVANRRDSVSSVREDTRFRRTSVQASLEQLQQTSTASVAFAIQNSTVVKEGEAAPLLADHLDGDGDIDIEEGRSLPFGVSAAVAVSNSNRKNASSSTVPDALRRRGTTTGDAIMRYQSHVSVIPPKAHASRDRLPAYDVEFRVTKGAKDLIGSTLQQSALYRMKGVEIYLHVAAGKKKPQFARTEDELPEMGALSAYFLDSQRSSDGGAEMRDADDIVIEGGCILGVRASAKVIGKLSRQFHGLVPSADYYDLLGKGRKQRQMFEVVLSDAYLAKLSVKRFFLEHDAVILGVDAESRLVLVEGFSSFAANALGENVKLVSAVPSSRPPRSSTLADTLRGLVAFVGFIAIIGVCAIPGLKVGKIVLEENFPTMIIGLGVLLVALRCITWSQALGSLNGGVLLLFAFADALQTIMSTSGTSQFLANLIAKATGGSHVLSVFGTGITVSLLTQFLNNATCTQMLWDSTLALCHNSGIPIKPMMCLLAHTSGYAFCTPIGMPPTLLVRVAGNYSFFDYLKAGWLLQLISTLLCCSLVSIWVTYETSGGDQPNTRVLFN